MGKSIIFHSVFSYARFIKKLPVADYLISIFFPLGLIVFHCNWQKIGFVCSGQLCGIHRNSDY